VWLVMVLFALASGCGLDSDGDDARGERRPTGAERIGGPPTALVERLRAGGHVLAFRHAATDSGMDTTDDLSDCSRQRNLSGEGRRQSRRVGRAFRQLGIPVGRVLASPFCRSRDTARLAFGRARPSRSLLAPEFFANASEARRKGLRRLLAVRPRRGTNTVLVSHGSAIYAATGEDPQEGEVVIASPRPGVRGFAVVTTLQADEWGH